MFMYDHVAAYLLRVQPVVPYLEQADHFEAQDMEHKNGQGVVTAEYEETFYDSFVFVNPRTYIINH